MKIVIAPDSWKECMSAMDVARNIADGMRQVFPGAQYALLPMADGGEGTVKALVEATRGRLVSVSVTGPEGKPVAAFYGLSDDGHCAFIEMAAASGLALVNKKDRDPMVATSRGTGELILAALNAGARKFILGIGGSATNDAGAGMLQALGVRLLDKRGEALPSGGAALLQLERIDTSGLDSRLASCIIEVACDVDNPLTGEKGASAVFGPQKGATREMVAQLDAALVHFAQVVQRDMAIDVLSLPGGGAAGGMGAALSAFCGATLRQGVHMVMDALGLETQLRDADIIITGEGRTDGQTACGKVPAGVAELAKRYAKPVIILSGSLEQDADMVYQRGVDAMFSVLARIVTLEEALDDAAINIRNAAKNIAQILAIGQSLGQ